MKTSSVGIAFKRGIVKSKGIKFNEIFGAGVEHFAGGENVFILLQKVQFLWL